MRLKLSSQHSMLEGSISKGLISFAVPIFVGNLFQQLYNTADTLIVGKALGKEALAAVSSSGNLIFMFVGLLNGIGMGAGVVIAKYFGARDNENLSKAVHTDIAFGLLAGLLLTVFGTTLSPVMLRLMGTPEDVFPNSVAYFRTYFTGAMAVMLYNIAAGILQAIGDSRHPLYYLMISSGINVLLDLLFVRVIGTGVEGAAAATVISQTVSAVMCLVRLTRSREVYRVEWKKVRFYRGMAGQILRFGLPSGIQNCVISLANVFVQANVNSFGTEAMAGSGSYVKLEGFAFLPVTSFAMALATFVGQNLGAKQYDRVKKGCRVGMACSMGLAELTGVIIFAFAPALIGMFTDDPEVLAIGIKQCHTSPPFYFVLAMSHCYAGIFRGAGKPSVPMTIMLCIWCLLRVTYISIAVRIIRDIVVVFSAYPITWTISSVLFTLYYFRADWIHTFDRLDAAKQGG